MNALSVLLHHPVTHRIGWVVLHSFWQGAVVGVAFALIRLALRRASANARYSAGCAALTVMIAAAVGTLLMLPSSPSNYASSPGAVMPVRIEPRGLANGPGAFPVFRGDSVLDIAFEFFKPVAPVAAAVWMIGVVLCSLKLTRACFWLRTIRHHEGELMDSVWMEKLNELRHRLGVSHSVRLLKSALIEVPTVIGWLRPVILLPAACVAGLTPAQLEAILAHELAHVRRFDYLVNAFQCLIETLLFYHPVVWWISRCVREERENCCDDLVVRVCGNRVAYARALATLEQARADLPQWAFAATGGSLLNRIRRLLGASEVWELSAARKFGGVTLIGIGMTFIGLGVYLFAGSKLYSSTARIRIEPNPPPYFIQTEFEVIQSAAILDKVIADLDLNEKWGKKYARGEKLETPQTRALLKGRMDLHPVRNTELVKIRFFSDDPGEAAKIAQAIAEQYQLSRQEARLKSTSSGVRARVQALQREWDEQDHKTRKAQDQVDDLRQKYGISSLDGEETAHGALVANETLRKLEAMRIENKAQVTGEEALLKQLETLKAEVGYEALGQAIPAATSDSLLTELFQQLNLSEQGLIRLRNQYGPNHPEVWSEKLVIDDLHRKITNRVDGFLAGLQARVSSSRKRLDDLEKEIDLAGMKERARTEEIRPYFAAKQNLEELQRFRQVLTMKIASENIDAALPRHSMVQVIDHAVPGLRPVSPNRPRGVGLIVLGLILDLLGLRLLRGRRKTEPGPAVLPAPA